MFGKPENLIKVFEEIIQKTEKFKKLIREMIQKTKNS